MEEMQPTLRRSYQQQIPGYNEAPSPQYFPLQGYQQLVTHSSASCLSSPTPSEASVNLGYNNHTNYRDSLYE